MRGEHLNPDARRDGDSRDEERGAVGEGSPAWPVGYSSGRQKKNASLPRRRQRGGRARRLGAASRRRRRRTRTEAKQSALLGELDGPMEGVGGAGGTVVVVLGVGLADATDPPEDKNVGRSHRPVATRARTRAADQCRLRCRLSKKNNRVEEVSVKNI
jgi:hypothetical protein